MIPDSYTRLAEVAGFWFLYRPIPPHYGSALMRRANTLPDHFLERFIHHIVDSQVVLCDWTGGAESLDEDVLEEVFRVISQPTDHEENLYRGAVIAFAYPHLDSTPCSSCKAYLWNPLTGELHRDNAGNPVRREGKTLCQLPMGCPKGTPENPVELTPENRQAFDHYRMTGGAGSPADELVARNWAILRKAEEDAQRLRQNPQGYARAVGRGRQRSNLQPRHVRERTAGATAAG